MTTTMSDNDVFEAGAGHAADAELTLQRERDELQDRLLRTAAEFDNYRKRTEREKRDWSDATTAEILRDVLPILDDLERALAAPPAEDGGDAGLRAGVELIRRQFAEVLKRRGVEPIEAIGQDFDPMWHEAVAHEPANGRRDDEITGELRRGYRIGQRLLRPAQVRVAKA